MLDLDRQLREFGSFVDETVEPVRAAEVTDRPIPPAAPVWRRHVAIAGIAAVFIVLVIAAVAILDPFGSEAPFIEEPTTIPVTTTLVTPTTEASDAPTSTTAVLAEPPVISWTRIDDPVALGGDEYQGMIAVESGPMGLIAVGVDWGYPQGPDLIGIDGALWTSPDGAQWSRIGLEAEAFGGLGDQFLTSIAVGAEGIVVGGWECPRGFLEPGCRAAAWISEDAATWEKVPDDAGAFEGAGQEEIRDVIATEEGFLAVGSGVWISTDGRRWERIIDLDSRTDSQEAGRVMTSVVQTPDGFIAAGYMDSDAAIWTSTDGRDWLAERWEDGEWIMDLLIAGNTILGVGQGDIPAPSSPIVWRSVDGGEWEQIAVGRFSGHEVEWMMAASQVGGWVLSTGFHNDFNTGNELRAYYKHGEVLVWGSSDDGGTWTVLPTEGDVLGNYLSDHFPVWVGDMTLWNNRIVMVGSRGINAGDYVPTEPDYEGPTWQTVWDAAVWIGTIED